MIQDGLLSSDLYKVYNNPFLDRKSGLYIGGKVCEVCCACPAHCDDVTVIRVARSPQRGRMFWWDREIPIANDQEHGYANHREG